MVLVTGPTGSGKTTTLYAALNELNTPEKKIITVEDPVEYRLPGLNQVQVHEKIDLSFSACCAPCLRQDPDIILIGEMRDQETAEIGMRAAMTGHLVLSTLHTNDACRRRSACSTWACRATWWPCRSRWCSPSAGARHLRKLCRTPYADAARAFVAASTNWATRSTASYQQGQAAAIAPTPATRGARPSMSSRHEQRAGRGDQPRRSQRIHADRPPADGRQHPAPRCRAPGAKGRTTIEEAMRISNAVRGISRRGQLCLQGTQRRPASSCEGVLEGATPGAVADLLLGRRDARWRSSGNFRTAAPASGAAGRVNLFKQKVEHIDVLLFSRQIHTLLRAGVPIMRALAACRNRRPIRR
jgi:energy-coupling factor transporter ATP-binding protein EcfA2